MSNDMRLSPSPVSGYLVGNESNNLSQSGGTSLEEYRRVTRSRGLAPVAGKRCVQMIGISGGRDLLRRDTFSEPKYDIDSQDMSKKMCSIVDGIIARDTKFNNLNRQDLDEILKLYMGKMPYEELVSIGKKDLEFQIKRIMDEEYFLSPRFFVDMPYRKRTTVSVTINRVTRGLPSAPDFED